MNAKKLFEGSFKKWVWGACVCALTTGLWAREISSAFSLDNVFDDHMVLQRGKQIRFTGESTPGRKVLAWFHGARQEVETDTNGFWCVTYPAEAAGGPYTVRFAQDEDGYLGHIELQDVWVGEVWLVSGQSNMSYPVSAGKDPYYHLPNGEAVAAAADDAGLRLLRVAKYSNCIDGPCRQLPGRPHWYRGDEAAAVSWFSAVGYLVGREMRRVLGSDIKVGIICAAWSGTHIEPWIPREQFILGGYTNLLKDVALNTAPACYAPEAEARYEAREEEIRAELVDWIENKFFKTDPATSADAVANWSRVDLPLDQWKIAPHAAMEGLAEPGVAWYRFAYELPEKYANQPLVFHIDYVNDADESYYDGVKIGATGLETPNYWSVARDYPVPASSAGRHVLAIRAIDHNHVGLVGETVALKTPSGEVVVDFTHSNWCERVEFRTDPLKIGLRPAAPGGLRAQRHRCQSPSTLYNAMVNPLTPLNLAGVIWYQGESNSDEYWAYGRLQACLIAGWRKAFRDENMPFIITELAPFVDHRPEHRFPDDFWQSYGPDYNLVYAPIRGVQDAFLDEPFIGVASTIDIGDHSSVHPSEKLELARRLVLEASRLAWGNSRQEPGPRADKATRENEGVRITFKNKGSGLFVRGGEVGPHLCAVQDELGVWHWVEGRWDDSTGTLFMATPNLKPKKVRYAWSAYPPNPPLYRVDDNLPVFPFELSCE